MFAAAGVCAAGENAFLWGRAGEAAGAFESLGRSGDLNGARKVDALMLLLRRGRLMGRGVDDIETVELRVPAPLHHLPGVPLVGGVQG